jgi:hypothetical protein
MEAGPSAPRVVADFQIGDSVGGDTDAHLKAAGLMAPLSIKPDS